MASQRTLPLDSFFWLDGMGGAKGKYELIVQKVGGSSVFDTNSQAWHAFNHELVNATNFENRNDDDTITLMRTEGLAVIQQLQLPLGDHQVIMPRGVTESTSIYQK